MMGWAVADCAKENPASNKTKTRQAVVLRTAFQFISTPDDWRNGCLNVRLEWKQDKPKPGVLRAEHNLRQLGSLADPLQHGKIPLFRQ